MNHRLLYYGLNMKYKFYCLSFFLLFFTHSAKAHNTQQASFKLVLTGDASFIDISLSQYGIEQALLKSYPELNLSATNTSLFKETLVRHLKENIHISVNGKPLKMAGGLIKLGSHQSMLKFKVSNIKGMPKQLLVKITCFEQNERQKNIFTVVYGEKVARSILNTKNDYKAHFIFTASKIEASDAPESSK